MPEIDRKENRHRHSNSTRLCGNETKITRSSNRRRIERSVGRSLGYMRRLAYHLSFLVDIEAKGDVGLNLLRVKRRWISERQILVEHCRKLFRSATNTRECLAAVRVAASSYRKYHHKAAHDCSSHRHCDNLPLPRLPHEAINQCQCFQRRHRIRISAAKLIDNWVRQRIEQPKLLRSVAG